MVAEAAAQAVDAQGRFTWAVSGGRTPWAMLARLAERMPWEETTVFQVDERVAPDGDPDRNLVQLEHALPLDRVELRPMPVTAADLDAAAAEYAASLPAAFDLVHLGLGADGHTASLVPGDPVLGVTDRAVALTGLYEGRRRMTLTYPALDRARSILWIVVGPDKAAALGRLLARDPSIPATRVSTENALVLADRAAAG